MPRSAGSGPVAFFVSVFIVALGTIQLVSTFHTYALNLSELNGLKKQEASLIAQKKELENNIARWDDKAYVTAQARDRLGFVFPGEQAIRVLHPEAVTGESTDESGTSNSESQKTSLPWYEELDYSFKQADQSDETDASEQTESQESVQENGQNDEQTEQNSDQDNDQDNDQNSDQQSGDQ